MASSQDYLDPPRASFLAQDSTNVSQTSSPANSTTVLPKSETDNYRSNPTKKSRGPVFWLACIAALIVIILAVILPVYFVVIKKDNNGSSSAPSNSGNEGGSDSGDNGGGSTGDPTRFPRLHPISVWVMARGLVERTFAGEQKIARLLFVWPMRRLLCLAILNFGSLTEPAILCVHSHTMIICLIRKIVCWTGLDLGVRCSRHKEQ